MSPYPLAWPARVLLTVLCLLPAAIKLARYPAYPGSDDAFIHLAIVENIHRGDGWGINPGERVFLSTSPAFTACFATIRSLTPSVMPVGMGLSCVASALYVLGVFALARRLTGQPLWGFAAATLAATNVHLWRWTGTFMEVTFAMAAAIWLIHGVARIQDMPAKSRATGYGLIGLGIAVAVATRPELGLLFPAFAAHCALLRRRHAMGDIAALTLGLAAGMAPILTALYKTFGSIYPTTAAAKTSAGLLWLNIPVWSQVAKVTATGCLGSLIILGISLIIRRHTHRLFARVSASTVLWLFPALGFVFYALKMPGLQSPARYWLPFLSTIPVLAAVAGAATWEPGRQTRILVGVSCAIQLALALVLNERQVSPVLNQMVCDYTPTMREASSQIAAHAKPGDTALIYMDIGVVAATRPAGIRLLDGGALATPAFRNLSLMEMALAARPQFVLENQGTPERFVEQSLLSTGIPFKLIWSRAYRSHSVGHPNDVYEARLFQVQDAP